MQGVRYELHTMLISAAAAGLGVALVPKFFVEEQLQQLGLVVPCDAATVGDSAYYLVYPTEFSHSKPLESFRGWLLEQASAYAAPERDARDADEEDDEDVE
jgi:DNA-binding transcriptional LysR family regulator